MQNTGFQPSTCNTAALQYRPGAEHTASVSQLPEIIMKTVSWITSLALGMALVAGLSAAAWAQGGPGPGAGKGPGARSTANASQQNSPRAQGTGAGAVLLTAQERAEHQERMTKAKTYEECLAIQNEQRTLLQSRAQERGITAPQPPANVCEMRKERGQFGQ